MRLTLFAATLCSPSARVALPVSATWFPRLNMHEKAIRESVGWNGAKWDSRPCDGGRRGRLGRSGARRHTHLRPCKLPTSASHLTSCRERDGRGSGNVYGSLLASAPPGQAVAACQCRRCV